MEHDNACRKINCPLDNYTDAGERVYDSVIKQRKRQDTEGVNRGLYEIGEGNRHKLHNSWV